MDDDPILPQKKKGENQILPRNNDDEWNPSVNKNGEDRIPQKNTST